MKRRIKMLLALMAALTLLCGVSASAWAYELPDTSRNDCTLTIWMRYGGEDINGGTITLYKVGFHTEDGFQFHPELRYRSGIDDPMSEQTARELAENVERYNISPVAETEVRDGRAYFDALSAGLYLAVQNEAAEGFNALKPFVISIPRWDAEQGGYVYNVEAIAKTELSQNPEPDDTPSPSPSPSPAPDDTPRLPQTGQLNWPVPVLLVLGAALIVLGLAMRRGRDDA